MSKPKDLLRRGSCYRERVAWWQKTQWVNKLMTSRKSTDIQSCQINLSQCPAYIAELFGHCANIGCNGSMVVVHHTRLYARRFWVQSQAFLDFTGSLCVCGFSFHSPQTLTSLSIDNSWPCDKYVNNWCVSCDGDLSFIPVTHSRKCRKTQLMVFLVFYLNK